MPAEVYLLHSDTNRINAHEMSTEFHCVAIHETGDLKKASARMRILNIRDFLMGHQSQHE